MRTVKGISFTDDEWLTLQSGVLQSSLAVLTAGGQPAESQLNELVNLATQGKYTDPLQHSLMRSVAEHYSEIEQAVAASGDTVGDTFAAARTLLGEKLGGVPAVHFLLFFVETARRVATAPSGTETASQVQDAVLFRLTQLCFPEAEWQVVQYASVQMFVYAAASHGTAEKQGLRELVKWETESECGDPIHAALLMSIVADWELLFTAAQSTKFATLVNALTTAYGVCVKYFDERYARRSVACLVARSCAIGIHADPQGAMSQELLNRLAAPTRLCFSDEEWLAIQRTVLKTIMGIAESDGVYSAAEKEVIGSLLSQSSDYADPIVSSVVKSLGHEDMDALVTGARADSRTAEDLTFELTMAVADRFGVPLARYVLDNLLDVARSIAFAPDDSGELTSSENTWLLEFKEAIDGVIEVALAGRSNATEPEWLRTVKEGKEVNRRLAAPAAAARREQRKQTEEKQKRAEEEKRQQAVKLFSGSWKQEPVGGLAALITQLSSSMNQSALPGIPSEAVSQLLERVTGEATWQLGEDGRLSGHSWFRLPMDVGGFMAGVVELTFDATGTWTYNDATKVVVFDGELTAHAALNGVGTGSSASAEGQIRKFQVKKQSRDRWEATAEDGSEHVFRRAS